MNRFGNNINGKILLIAMAKSNKHVDCAIVAPIVVRSLKSVAGEERHCIRASSLDLPYEANLDKFWVDLDNPSYLVKLEKMTPYISNDSDVNVGRETLDEMWRVYRMSSFSFCQILKM